MAAELKIGIGADNTGLNKGLQDAEKQISAFVTKVGKIGQIGEQLASIGQKMSVGLTLPIVALGGAAIKAYGDLQALEMGLRAVMGTAGLASGELEKLREVAKLPGLGLKEAVRGSVALQSAGFSADDARRSLMAFGNALATVGKGANELAFVNLALTQIQNKTSGFGQDLRQLTEQLPQLRGAMETAFGTSNSEDIAKLGYTGKEVVAMLTTEFEKLPKVTGGIKNAFENLSDNLFINMSRIGKIIDDTFDISGIIDKLTGYLDSAVSAFENLSPSVQKTILVVTGLVAAAGPLLVAVGSLIAMGPQLLLLLGGIKVAMLAITGPVGAVILAIAGLTAAYFALRDSTKTSADRMLEWGESLRNANAQANTQVNALDALYKKTQDTTLSIKERKAAVDDLQAQYPYYFKNIKDEIILNGGAVKSYQNLRVAIYDAARAKAAQGEIDKRASERLQTELDLRKRLSSAIQTYQAPKAQSAPGGGTMAGSGGTYISEKEVKESARKSIYWIQTELNRIGAVTKAEDAELMKIIEAGTTAISTVYGNGGTETATAITGSAAKVKTALTTASTEIKEFENEFAQNTAGIKIGALEFDNFIAFDSFINGLKERMAVVPQIFNESKEPIVESVRDFGKEFTAAVQQLVDEGAVELLTQSFEAMGGAIAQGGNILQAAGGAILGVLGQFMQMLGKEMIKLAVGTIALGSLVKGIKAFIIANPGAAIALAGVAIVAGTLLSAAGSNIGGGGSSSSGSVPSGGGNASQSYSSSFSGGGSGGEGRVVFEISGNNLIGVLDRAKDRNTRLGG